MGLRSPRSQVRLLSGVPDLKTLPDLNFKLDLRTPRTHEFRLELELDAAQWPVGPGGRELFLPVWTPGSYLIREYSRHVSGLKAADAGSGQAIAVSKVAKNRWRFDVPSSSRRIRVSWSVYGHELTVRTADLTEQHAFWNGACLFLWPVGAEGSRAGIEVLLPDGWKLASALCARETGPGRWHLLATDLDDLVDSPSLAGQLQTLDFEVLGKPHSYVLEGLDGITAPPSLLTDTRRVIEEAAKVFGGTLPYERYDFLSIFTDSGRGGLEHLASSVLLAPRTTFAPRKQYEDFVSLVAHEHFHLWNVKRMRPSSLWRFDYENENYTPLLWVAEGFTSYYDDHLCLRAGVITRDRYLEILAETITELRSIPGRLAHPLALASFDTWIKFYRPDEHTKNSSHSYYSSGSLAALCIDLKIRAATGGARSLDDALRELYRISFGSGRGYTHEDVLACIDRAAGQDLAAYVERLVNGPFDPDFAEVLAPFGVRLVKKPEGGAPYFGVQWKSDELVVQSVVVGDPAHAAGLAPGDELLAVEGLRVRPSTWKSVLENLGPPGRPLRLLIARRGRVLEKSIAPVATPDSVKLELIAEPDERQRALRASWLV